MTTNLAPALTELITMLIARADQLDDLYIDSTELANDLYERDFDDARMIAISNAIFALADLLDFTADDLQNILLAHLDNAR